MSARESTGWQTALADLSLILFMVTAAAVGQQPLHAVAREGRDKREAAVAADGSPALSPQSEPLAVYVDAPGVPPLAGWLAEQAVDPRQQLTITAHYGSAPGAQEHALAAAIRLADEAGKAGRTARLVVEPGAGPPRVAIAFDSPDAPARTSGHALVD